MSDNKLLILIPTYNERENITRICRRIFSLYPRGLDLLFIDDNSPDGTGLILNQLSKIYKNVLVVHRQEKSGVGSAHLHGIKWAYKNNYEKIITMDCDSTHNPSYIKELISLSKYYDVMTTSRFLKKGGLRGWNIYRKLLSHFGHLATKLFLGMKYDATGAYRLYNLKKIPKKIFSLIKSRDYSFFFESLYVLNLNKFTIKEIPIYLPPRTYGHSKMKAKHIFASIFLIFALFFQTLFNRKKFIIPRNEK